MSLESLPNYRQRRYICKSKMTAGEKKPHSKLGMLACLTAIGVWVYFVAAFYLIFYVDGFTKTLSDLFIPESHGMTDLGGMGAAVVLFAVIFFVIPAGGHLFGLLISVIGLFRSSRKRLFSALGLFLNLLPMLILLVLFVIGSLIPAK